MKTYKVKDLMVPLSEYSTVSDKGTLLDAVTALKMAQEAFDNYRYRHQAVMVLDGAGKLVGKLGQHELIEALEPNYTQMRNSLDSVSTHRLGFSSEFIKSTMEQYHLWEKPLVNLCKKAASQKVHEVMYIPSKDEYIKADTSLNEAIHRLIMGRYRSLIVNEGEKSIGVLKLTDVSEYLNGMMQTCAVE